MLRTKLLYLILLGGLVLFWILYRGTLSLQLLLFALAMPFLLLLILLVQSACVRVQLRHDVTEVGKDESFYWLLDIRNRSIFPIVNLELQLSYRAVWEAQPKYFKDFFVVPPRNTGRTRYDFHANVCGQMELRVHSITLYDPLHLFSMRMRCHACDTVLVMPERLPLEEEMLPQQVSYTGDATTFSPTRPGDDPSEIFAMHAYRAGDALSRIHWKLSSKLDTLMVKEYSLPLCADTLLLPDMRLCADDSHAAQRLDAMFSAFYTVAEHLREAQLPLSMLWQPEGAAGYVVCPLSEPDDLEQMLRQMLCSKPHAESIDAACDAVEQLPTPPAQIVLLTPKLDAHLASLLPMLAQRCPLTVFHAVAHDAASASDASTPSAEPDASEAALAAADAYHCIPVYLTHPQIPAEAAAQPEEGDELPCAENP